MQSNSPFARLPLIALVIVTTCAGFAISVPEARAQDSVTGGAPVFSKPKDQPPPSPDIAKEVTQLHSLSNLVTTPVVVINSSGEFVFDLNEKDFQILDNGVAQHIQSFETELNPLSLVIVVETNSTVAPLLDAIHPLASMFSSLLIGAQGHAAVIFYNDRVRVAQGFTNDSDRLEATLKDFTARGDGARLNDALSRAVSLLETRPKSERRVIIAFSDGFDSGSDTQKDEVVQRATTAEVAIYGLGFNPARALLDQKPVAPPDSPLDTNVTRPTPPGIPRTPTNSANVYSTPVPVIPIMIATGQIIRSAMASSLLEYYAGYTGGVFYSHWKDKVLQDQLNRIASEIQSQYELAYVPDALSQSGFHRIEVRVRRPGLKVRARAGYFLPEKSP